MGLKGLFIKEEEQQQEKPKEVAPTVASVMPTQTPITTGTGEVDKEIETKIWEMIVAKNLPGPDYIEFKNVASGLTEIVPDENLRMKGAFNVLLKSYPNFTKEIILNSIDTYIGIVGEEKEKGRTECEELRRTRIGNKEARIKELKESSADILRQIEELKKKNDAINQETLELEEEIRKSSEEIDRKERVFESSVQSVINTLESDKTRVTNLSL
jgi:hypothetical protein